MSSSIEISADHKSSNGKALSLNSVPRLCHLRKWPEHDHGSLGFNLITKKSGHFIERIDIGSPAYYCGLKDGDKIHEINGVNVIKRSHKDVANMIGESTSTGTAKLLVTDSETESRLKSLGLEVTTGSSDYQVEFRQCPEQKPDDGLPEPRTESKETYVNPGFEPDEGIPPPSGYKNQPPARLCHLTKSSSEDFGMIVRTYQDTGDKIVLKLDTDGVAALRGVRKGDHIIEINGYNIMKENHSQIINRIISSGNVLKLLVVSEKENAWYKERGLIPRSTHCIEYKTEPKERQTGPKKGQKEPKERQTDGSSGGKSGTSSTTQIQQHSSDSSVKGSSQGHEQGHDDSRGDWCGTGRQQSESVTHNHDHDHDHDQEEEDAVEATYSRPMKPYDEVIEELENKLAVSHVDTNGKHSIDSKSEGSDEIPLNDMTLENHSIVREQSVMSNHSAVSEKIRRFEVMTGNDSGSREGGDEEDDDGKQVRRQDGRSVGSKDDQESGKTTPALEGELSGLNKSVKEIREELERKGKKKRGRKPAAAERMI